ncbi:unnamed protein product [Closterium sp. Naga37s-1]|nr:unnamed protein product [Closterium sp. Naga37s-1]
MDDPEVLLPAIERRTKQLRQQEQMLREAVTAASRRKETSAAALKTAEDAHQQLLRARFPALNAQVNAQLDAMAAHAAAIAAFLSPARPGSLAMVAGVEPLLEAQEELALQHEVWKRRQFDEGPSRAVAQEGLGQYSPCDLNDLHAGVVGEGDGGSHDTPDAIYRRNIRELKHGMRSNATWQPWWTRPAGPSGGGRWAGESVGEMGEGERCTSESSATWQPWWTRPAGPSGGGRWAGESVGEMGEGERCTSESSATWQPWWTRLGGPSGGGRWAGQGGEFGHGVNVSACACGCMLVHAHVHVHVHAHPLLSSHPFLSNQPPSSPSPPLLPLSPTPPPLPQLLPLSPNSFPSPRALLIIPCPPVTVYPAPLAHHSQQQQQWRQQQGGRRERGAERGGAGGWRAGGCGGARGEEAEEAAGGVEGGSGACERRGDYELKIQRQCFYLANMHQLLSQQYWQLAANVALHGAVLLDAHHLERTRQLLLQLHCNTSAAMSDSKARKAAYKALAAQATAPTAPTARTAVPSLSSHLPPPSSSLPVAASLPLWPALLSALSPHAAQGEPLGAAGRGGAQAAGGREGESAGEVVGRLVEGLRGRAQGEGERVQQGLEQSERLLAHMSVGWQGGCEGQGVRGAGWVCEGLQRWEVVPLRFPSQLLHRRFASSLFLHPASAALSLPSRSPPRASASLCAPRVTQGGHAGGHGGAALIAACHSLLHRRSCHASAPLAPYGNVHCVPLHPPLLLPFLPPYAPSPQLSPPCNVTLPTSAPIAAPSSQSPSPHSPPSLPAPLSSAMHSQAMHRSAASIASLPPIPPLPLPAPSSERGARPKARHPAASAARSFSLSLPHSPPAPLHPPQSAVQAPRHAIRQRVLHSFFSPGALPHALLLAHPAQGGEGEGLRSEVAGREVRETQGRTDGQERESRGGGGEGMGMDDDRGEGMGMEGGMHVGMGMGMEEDDDSIIF